MDFNFQNIVGFDISHWQGSVDFQKMKAGGASFVILKAGQGNWKDERFDENWKNAKGVLPRASYHYYDNRYDPKDQARKYYDILRTDLEGTCWLDLEDRTAGVYAGWRHWYTFLEELKFLLYPGAQVGIYSNFFFLTEMLTYANTFQRNYFKQYPLWLANYGTDPFHPRYESVLMPSPWTECLILQSGTPDIGIEAGVESREIDYNQFNGDANKFSQYFKVINGASVPEEEATMTTLYGEVITSTLNIRTGAGTNFEDLGNFNLYVGDKVESNNQLGNWWQLSKIVRKSGVIEQPADGAQWWASSGGGTYIRVYAPPVPVVTFPAEISLIIGDTTQVYVIKQ
jgi:lysozyme